MGRGAKARGTVEFEDLWAPLYPQQSRLSLGLEQMTLPYKLAHKMPRTRALSLAFAEGILFHALLSTTLLKMSYKQGSQGWCCSASTAGPTAGGTLQPMPSPQKSRSKWSRCNPGTGVFKCSLGNSDVPPRWNTAALKSKQEDWLP